jgi:RNase P/RNase MRP subunit p29
MKVTPDIIRYEFTGTEVKVVRSTHRGYVGLRGKVINETRNTFTMLHNCKRKIVVKLLLFSISSSPTEPLLKLMASFLLEDLKTASKSV